MRGISLWEPWCSALFTPHPAGPGMLKLHETRSRPYPHALNGERVFFQAAKRRCRPEELAGMVRDVMAELHGADWPQTRAYGHILGTAVLEGCYRTEDPAAAPDAFDRAFGDWTPGRFAWRLKDAQLLPAPIPWKANQGWMRYPWEAA